MKKEPSEIFIQDYDYELPPEQIAAFPLRERDNSKLLVYEKGVIKDEIFRNLPFLLPQNTTMVLNNTRVIEARIFFQKQTGAYIEIFCLEPYFPDNISEAMIQAEKVQWRCLIGGASKWKKGQLLHKEMVVHNKSVVLTARYIQKIIDSFIIEFSWNSSFPFEEILQAAGSIPLPPYIKREADAMDAERYQTVFARHKGSVAAPTAALHFTAGVFQQLTQKNIQLHYITLHVGAGTFKPVKSETISGHSMHAEMFSVSRKVLKNLMTAESIIAVGTTTLRTLESLHWLGVKLLIFNNALFTLEQWEAYRLAEYNISYYQSLKALLRYLEETNAEELRCKTSLIIIPGYQFFSARVLITNFHQPRSTLLLLVAAFIGDDWRNVYAHALKNGYRFLSYGDSSLLWRD
ncbi:MAG: S-adenosylmethionine:tRNA ribosyltransferase-isomerase [Flavisolibacter sp.]|nr:S-adenosylmethionine:tRNA ribosyltransferase-isomerase [Flavisolibacter sp.]